MQKGGGTPFTKMQRKEMGSKEVCENTEISSDFTMFRGPSSLTSSKPVKPVQKCAIQIQDTIWLGNYYMMQSSYNYKFKVAISETTN